MRFAVADAAALVLFTTVGLLSHGFELEGYARDTLPLLACWFAVAYAIGLYRRPRRLLANWVVAVPLAWLLRALALGRDFDAGEFAFLGVSLGGCLVCVAGARALAALLP